MWRLCCASIIFVAACGPQRSPYVQNTPIRFDLAAKQKRRTTWWNLVKQFSVYSRSLPEKLIDEMRSRFGGRTNGSKAGEAFRQRFSLLTADEIRQLVAMGMSVGSHTVDHPILSLQGSEMARVQISEGRTLLEHALQQPVWALAYPFGDTASVSGQRNANGRTGRLRMRIYECWRRFRSGVAAFRAAQSSCQRRDYIIGIRGAPLRFSPRLSLPPFTPDCLALPCGRGKNESGIHSNYYLAIESEARPSSPKKDCYLRCGSRS